MQSDFHAKVPVNRKVLVTLAAGKYLQLLEMSRITFIEYAKKWDYDYVEVTETLDKSRPYAWTKLLAIRELLDKYEFVFYVDSDALILRGNTDIETITQADFAWPVGPVNGQTCPSAGIMAIRSSEISKTLFDLAYNQIDLIYNGWWEQAALMRVLQYEDPRDNEKHWSEFNLEKLQIEVTELDSSWNSTIQEFANDPIIRHFAGDPFALKLLFMSEYILTRSYHDLGTKLTKDEEQRANDNYLQGRSQIFSLQITWQDKFFRVIRRIWSKIWKTPRYKYK